MRKRAGLALPWSLTRRSFSATSPTPKVWTQFVPTDSWSWTSTPHRRHHPDRDALLSTSPHRAGQHGHVPQAFGDVRAAGGASPATSGYRQFLGGRRIGPIGMSEETKAYMAEQACSMPATRGRCRGNRGRAAADGATPGCRAQSGRRVRLGFARCAHAAQKGPGTAILDDRGHAQVRGARNRPVGRARMRPPDRHNRMIRVTHITRGPNRVGRWRRRLFRADHATFICCRPRGGSRRLQSAKCLGR